MSTPEFILELRKHIGHAPLWLSGATAVVVRKTAEGDDEVLLVQRSDNKEWTPVTGIVDPGEHPKVTATREVMEETGVTAEVTGLAWLSVSDPFTYPGGDQARYVEHVFRCRWLHGEPEVCDDESLQAAFFRVDALPPMTNRFSQAIEIALRDQPATSLEDVRETTVPDPHPEPTCNLTD